MEETEEETEEQRDEEREEGERGNKCEHGTRRFKFGWQLATNNTRAPLWTVYASHSAHTSNSMHWAQCHIAVLGCSERPQPPLQATVPPAPPYGSTQSSSATAQRTQNADRETAFPVTNDATAARLPFDFAVTRLPSVIARRATSSLSRDSYAAARPSRSHCCSRN